jgi:hypothetical protein
LSPSPVSGPPPGPPITRCGIVGSTADSLARQNETSAETVSAIDSDDTSERHPIGEGICWNRAVEDMRPGVGSSVKRCKRRAALDLEEAVEAPIAGRLEALHRRFGACGCFRRHRTRVARVARSVRGDLHRAVRKTLRVYAQQTHREARLPSRLQRSLLRISTSSC